MKVYENFSFIERKKYEETFVTQDSSLIQELTGAGCMFNISQTPLNKRAGLGT
jgi:hypothetical protein